MRLIINFGFQTLRNQCIYLKKKSQLYNSYLFQKLKKTKKKKKKTWVETNEFLIEIDIQTP